MGAQQNTDRIMTTHVGSLPRPHDLLDMMKARLAGNAGNEAVYQERVRAAVAECVRRQAGSGIDIVCDGEQSKSGFFTYVRERLDGFEARPQQRRPMFAAEVAAFPEYYAEYFRTAMTGGAVAPVVPLVCTGPIRYRGEAALQRDIDNLKAALAGGRTLPPSCRQWRRVASAPTSTTPPMRRSFMPWVTRCILNIGRSSTPGSSCRSMIHFCPICSAIRRSTPRNAVRARRSTSQR